MQFDLKLDSSLQFLVFGQDGENGQSATHPVPVEKARNLGFGTVPMLPRLLPVMATQSRRLHAHQTSTINHSAKMALIQVACPYIR